MKYADRITFNPNQCGGRPCIRGMRIRVKDVPDMLAGAVPESKILQDFPYLQPEDFRACLRTKRLVLTREPSVRRAGLLDRLKSSSDRR